MSAPVPAGELARAASDALRWLGKAIAVGAFANCVNPKAAVAAFERLERAVSNAGGAA